ncbi:MerR family transcriptional regulator [Candidatus Pantoea formicae]|uniref:MerR family transcriptional regulator n=1 Tax=Candidatus Pantoea formicae TaxID=2608355 RepID=UPI003EDAC30F
MPYHSTDTVCGITGTLPGTLRTWRRAGLITAPEQSDGYSAGQLSRIFTVLDMTSRGDTLHEVAQQLKGHPNAARSGWACQQEELNHQLKNTSDALLEARIRLIGNDYCGDDFVNCYLRPLNLWLRADMSHGAEERQARFHQAVVKHARHIISAAHRRKSVPLFLEAVSVTDTTEIWMEAIRLTGQGFRVEISSEVTGVPANAERYYEHHLMWCGAGISQLMHWNYRHRLLDGLPALLCGPEQAILTAA